MKRIGVDTGGTFTDSVLWDDETGLVGSAKVSSNKRTRRGAVIAAVAKLDEAAGDDVRYLIHGTTVATNADARAVRPAHRHALHGGLSRRAGDRPAHPTAGADLRSARGSASCRWYRRRDRLEIVERIDHLGEVIEPRSTKSSVRRGGARAGAPRHR